MLRFRDWLWNGQEAQVLREEMVVRNIVDWMRWGLGIEVSLDCGSNLETTIQEVGVI